MPLLELREVTKSFGDKVANDRISLVVEAGRVHAVVGENGACLLYTSPSPRD